VLACSQSWVSWLAGVPCWYWIGQQCPQATRRLCGPAQGSSIGTTKAEPGTVPKQLSATLIPPVYRRCTSRFRLVDLWSASGRPLIYLQSTSSPPGLFLRSTHLRQSTYGLPQSTSGLQAAIRCTSQNLTCRWYASGSADSF